MRKVAIVLLFATPAMAADLFTLKVPVNLSHLHPSVTKARVHCLLYGADPRSGARVSYGSRDIDFPVSGGKIHGMAFVAFTTEDFTPAQRSTLTSVDSGRCVLQLYAAGSYIQPNEGSTSPVAAHAAGTPFRAIADFTIH